MSKRCWGISVISLHKECKFFGSQSTPAKPLFGSGPIIVDKLLDTPVFSQPSVMLQMIIRGKTETTDIVYPGDWTCVSVSNVPPGPTRSLAGCMGAAAGAAFGELSTETGAGTGLATK